jgi:riboflavin biosynthesis pyrimidine reductase
VPATLLPLGPAGAPQTARTVVAGLDLGAGGRAGGRPRVAAAMIASADGRAAVAGRSVGLGHPADRALLRELRAAVDAILVGPGTLRAERYAKLLDPDQRAARAERGRAPHPVVATISRSARVPEDIPLFAEPGVPIQVYTEAAADVRGRGADVAVHRFEPGGARPAAVLAHLAAERGVRSVLCEGGPTLLRAVIADDCLDDMLLTLAPLLAAGSAPTPLEGEALDPPARLALRSVHRAEDHLFMHYVATP